MGIGFGTGVEGVARVGQFRQYDQVGTFACCAPGQCQASAHVALTVLKTDLRVVLDDSDTYGADGGTGFRHGGFLLLVVLEGRQ
ncbi:hypothetical protein D9M71_536970 [compost metagenome]